MPREFQFQNRMTREQRLLGWIYLPVHIVALPLCFRLYASFQPQMLSETDVNLLYYFVGLVFCLTVMFRFLREEFGALCDAPGRCLLSILAAVCATYAMNLVAGLLLLLFGSEGGNPGTADVLRLAGRNLGAVRAIAVFLAPLVEETLFRGVLFGSLRTRSSCTWAYLVSVAVFCVYHVWQYVVTSGDWGQLRYALLYVPVSIALAWCYERSGSLWTCIFFHMGFNAVSLAALTALR
jgi:membrane protease YdiL (CAAX protease family)